MNAAKILFFAALVVLVGLVALLLYPGRDDAAMAIGEPIVLHCAAGLRVPVSEIIAQYEDEFGIVVRPQYAGSGELAAQLEVAGGDLFLPADISYIEDARRKGLVQESIPAAYLTAGIAVPRGNPKNIRTLADLRRNDVRVSLANPSAAIGKFTKNVLSGVHLWKQIEENAAVFKFTVNDIAQDVATGAADAAIVWDAVVGLFDNLDFIHVPEFDQKRKTATIGVLTSSPNPTSALRFARYLTAADRGLLHFKDAGFEVVEGDRWELTPEITFFSGSMLRPAIETRLQAFEAREGVRIHREYEGCGTLVSMMQAGADPDAYFSCDMKFLDQVQERFEPGTVVSKNDVILLVRKDNPKNIQTLEDLLQADLKVGVAHPQKSALGALTVDLLKRLKLYEPLMATGNVEILASKGDELVNQMQIGALDAAILYRSNALASAQILDHCTQIAIDGDAQATQPFAIHRNTKHRQLMARFEAFLTGEESRQTFLKHGFQWELGK